MRQLNILKKRLFVAAASAATRWIDCKHTHTHTYSHTCTQLPDGYRGYCVRVRVCVRVTFDAAISQPTVISSSFRLRSGNEFVVVVLVVC